jgi:ligand-binding sensor domain-containing protein
MKLTFIVSALFPRNAALQVPAAPPKHRIRPGAMTMFIVAAYANACAAGATASARSASPAAWHVGPVPEVRAICHAGDSLWVGTNAGVIVADIRDPSRRLVIPAGAQLPSNSVRAIASRGDSVWVSTDAGVSLFSGGKVTVWSARSARPRASLPLRSVQGIAFGNRGEVLLATRGGGVGVLTRTKNFAITTRDSLIDQNVYDILERAGRPRLYACGAGLCAQVDDSTMVSFQAGAGFPRGEARQVVGDDRTAYVRIAHRGIFRFDGKRATALAAPPGISFLDATSISLGADHALWVAGPGWIRVMRANKWQTAQAPSLDWRVIVADGAGAFAGSSDGVVVALNRGAGFKLELRDGLPDPAVTSLATDGRESAWFVSGGNILAANASTHTVSVEKSPIDPGAVGFSPNGVLMAAGRWTVSRKDASGWIDMTPPLGDADPAFSSVFMDNQNRLWVGARNGALYRYDGEIWIRYEQPRTTAVAVRDTRAYPACDWALVGAFPMRGHGGTWTRFADWDSTSSAVDIAQSPAGEWFAATKNRLLRYDAARDAWQTIGVAGGARESSLETPGDITAIVFDSEGRLFIGTSDGFGCLVQGRAHWWNASDGIGGERVSDLAADASTLWVGYSADGFSAFPLAGLR